MIVVDTSALMAILLNEPAADACKTALARSSVLMMSAATLTEAVIVADNKNIGTDMAELIEGLGLQIIPLMPTSARRAAAAYAVWGKGHHPAALNFGDCFAYALAIEQGCPLLFVGNDFLQTDVKNAGIQV